MGIAVASVGMFALPSTVSLFSGQHDWYDIGDTGDKLPCIKCHADVYEEYLQTDAHYTLGNNTDPNAACYACHRANKSITYAQGGTASGDGEGGSTATAGQQAHAASTVACMLCHQYSASSASNYSVNTSQGPFAGGFSQAVNSTSVYDYVNPSITGSGSRAAHDEFVKGAITGTMSGTNNMEDANEACIACHTHVPVKINWTHAYSLEFNATYGESLPPTHFTVGNWSVNGTSVNTSYGNATGGASTTGFP